MRATRCRTLPCKAATICAWANAWRSWTCPPPLSSKAVMPSKSWASMWSMCLKALKRQSKKRYRYLRSHGHNNIFQQYFYNVNIGDISTQSRLVKFIFHEEIFMAILLDNITKPWESRMQVLSLEELDVVSGGTTLIDEITFPGPPPSRPKHEDSLPPAEP